MKKIFTILLLISLLAAVIFYGYKRQIINQSSDTKKVAATIFPLYDIARNIAGDQVDVVLVLPPGASPHSYEPSPDGIKKLQGSDALFLIGHGIDNWSLTMAESAGIEYEVTVDKNVKLLEMPEDHEPDDEDKHDESQDGMNPHYWLNMKNAEGIALQIRDELTELYPEYADEFNRNFEEYSNNLQAANMENASKIQALQNKKIATFHNAYSYFADEYGLNIVTTFEEFPGEEPSPDYLREFITTIEEHQVKVIFAEPQFSTRSLEPIAEDLDVSISQLDPIGGVEGRDSFISLISYNINQVISELSK